MPAVPVTADVPDAGPAPLRGYRAAIVGTGFMGRVHGHAVRASGGQVVGVVGSSLERAEAARTSVGGDRAFADLAELVDAVEVDVVHVCTPNHLHPTVTRQALDAGAHVVCEKPLAVDVASAAAMTDAARRAARVATVPFVYRFHPMAREARERVRRGDLGAVSMIHGGYLQDWLMLPSDDNWRVDPDLGGPTRVFGDIGSHWCDLAEFVTGDRIERLSAQTAMVNPERGDRRVVDTEDLVTIHFRTAEGVLGTALMSQVSGGRKNRLYLEVSGSRATLAFDQENPETLWWGTREANNVVMRDPETLSPPAARLATVPVGHPQGYQDCFNAFVADTAAAIAGDAPDGLPMFDDGLRAAVLAEAVVSSARDDGAWVEVRS